MVQFVVSGGLSFAAHKAEAIDFHIVIISSILKTDFSKVSDVKQTMSWDFKESAHAS